MDVYRALGVRPVVNAAATLTALGGLALADEVVDAMVSASRSSVDLAELHEAAGRRLAALTQNEGAYVTTGCAAGIVLGVLACMTGGDPRRIADLPEGSGLVRRVVIQRAHRIPYDRAVEFAGGELVEIGNVIQTFEWELERALETPTAAVLWVAGVHLPQHAALSLERTVALCQARGVPVIVDAAAQLPPVANLWHFTREAGADLALFSGGKALRGPQASGMMLGRRDLLAAAAANASPNQRLARALKVGKEEICGLVAAVERYVALDHEALGAHYESTVATWARALGEIRGVRARRDYPNEAGQPVPRLEIDLSADDAPCTGDALVAALWDGEPRVAVLPGPDGRVFVTPDTLASKDEEDLVLERLRAVLGGEERR